MSHVKIGLTDFCDLPQKPFKKFHFCAIFPKICKFFKFFSTVLIWNCRFSWKLPLMKISYLEYKLGSCQQLNCVLYQCWQLSLLNDTRSIQINHLQLSWQLFDKCEQCTPTPLDMSQSECDSFRHLSITFRQSKSDFPFQRVVLGCRSPIASKSAAIEGLFGTTGRGAAWDVYAPKLPRSSGNFDLHGRGASERPGVGRFGRVWGFCVGQQLVAPARWGATGKVAVALKVLSFQPRAAGKSATWSGLWSTFFEDRWFRVMFNNFLGLDGSWAVLYFCHPLGRSGERLRQRQLRPLGVGRVRQSETAPANPAGQPGQKSIQLKRFTWMENSSLGLTRDVSGSDGHTLALTQDGQVYSWGDGDYGKLGHGDCATHKQPEQVGGPLAGRVVECVSAGYRHSAAVADGALWTWGMYRRLWKKIKNFQNFWKVSAFL